MKPKISIIVPIFNMEPYLRRCLDSLISQRIKDIQIIAVNDGSTDGSLAILNQYAEKDTRILVIDKKNGGVSSARNAGISAAEGEYIGFVDPDDWVEASMYEEMYEAALHEQADIVMCTYIREFGTHSKEKVFPMPDKLYLEGEQIRNQILKRLVGPINQEVANPELLDAWGTVWSKLYRAERIKQHEIEFIDLQLIGSNEDSLFNINAFYYAETFVFLNKPFYHYWRANANSITSKHNPNLMKQFFNLYGLIESFLNEKQMEEEFHTALLNRISLNTLGLGLNILAEGNNVTAYQKLKAVKSVLGNERIRHSLERFETSYCPVVWRTFFLCAKYRFSIGFYLLLAAADYLRKTKR